MIRKRDFIKQSIIFLFSLLITIGFTSLIYSTLYPAIIKSQGGHIVKKHIILLQGKKKLRNFFQAIIHNNNPTKPELREDTLIDSLETNVIEKAEVYYHIIVGSFTNITQAQQKADKINGDFSTNIIVLPPTIEGYYRISYGKYSTLEEAKTKIKSIRTNINSDSWILSVEE